MIIKVYLSHKISGGGLTTSYAKQEKNCEKAVLIANLIKDAIPSLDIYCPGGQTERFVRIAYYRRYLTVKQILAIDCEILDNCDIVIIYVPKGDKLDGGRLVEYDYALAHHKQIWIFYDVEHVINQLAQYVLRI